MKNKEQKFKIVYEQSKDKVYRLCLGFMGNKTEHYIDFPQSVLLTDV